MVISAGILLYKIKEEKLKVFLVHPGGPVFKNKDIGAWSIPKGEVELNEKLIDAAIRELQEETGIVIKNTNMISLGDVVKNGKRIFIWAYKKDFNGKIKSNIIDHPTFGKIPEIDKGNFFEIEIAKEKISSGQLTFLERLEIKLAERLKEDYDD